MLPNSLDEACWPRNVAAGEKPVERRGARIRKRRRGSMAGSGGAG
jgi:hypothetical protein